MSLYLSVRVCVCARVFICPGTVVFCVCALDACVGTWHMAMHAEDVDWTFVFEKVWFSYPSRPQAQVLRNFSAVFQADQITGMVGSSGCGKSTVFALLQRMYDPQRGRILLGGRPLRCYNPLWLRRHLTVVSQACGILPGTIRENLLLGSPDGSSGTVMHEAMRAAGCYGPFFNGQGFL